MRLRDKVNSIVSQVSRCTQLTQSQHEFAVKHIQASYKRTLYSNYPTQYKIHISILCIAVELVNTCFSFFIGRQRLILQRISLHPGITNVSSVSILHIFQIHETHETEFEINEIALNSRNRYKLLHAMNHIFSHATRCSAHDFFISRKMNTIETALIHADDNKLS